MVTRVAKLLSSHTSTPLTSLRARSLIINSIATRLYTNNPIMKYQISRGEDESKVEAGLDALLENGWRLNEEDQTLEKKYYFKTYTKVLDFHQMIGVRSKAKDHHPKMVTTYQYLHVAWKTHNPPGLSAKDTFMAEYCDEQAKWMRTVAQSDAPKCGPGS